MAEEFPTILHRWFEEVWNEGRMDLIDQWMEPDVLIHGLNDPKGNPIRNIRDFKHFFRLYKQALIDLKIKVEDTVSEDGKIAGRCTVRAIHGGEGLGIPPTHNIVGFSGMVFLRLKDEKIVEVWNQFDFLTMYQQLGVVTVNLK